MEKQPASAIYTGYGQSPVFWKIWVKATYAGLDLRPISSISICRKISGISTSILQSQYGQAAAAGYKEEFYSLEKGVDDMCELPGQGNLLLNFFYE